MRIDGAIAALAGFICGIAGAEMAFGSLRAQAKAERPAPLLFSLEVRDATGSLLASPLLVGEEGRKVRLNLAQRSRPGVQMSLDLDPQPSGENAICLGFRLSMEGHQHAGRIGVNYGERRSLRLDGHEPLRLDFTVARAGSRAFDRILRARGRPLI